MDQVKVIRSQDFDYNLKLASVEWLVRYTEFVTPDIFEQAIAEFKKSQIDINREEAYKYVQHDHRSEAIPSLL